MRLHEHGVNLFEFDGATLVANGFEQRTDAEIACRAQVTFSTTIRFEESARLLRLSAFDKGFFLLDFFGISELE